MTTKLGYMGIDQYGNSYHDLQHPRKDLLERLGRSHASKMFADTKSGKQQHKGYVIGRYWISIYEVSTWSGTERNKA